MTSAVRATVSVFGVVAAVAGFEHGVGAILQGNVPPAGIFFESWPNTPAYEILSGEPAMTVVPNLLASGVLTVLLSTILAVWSIASIDSPRGGPGILVLSALLLLVGGGFGPPLVGFVVGLAATRADAGRTWMGDAVSPRRRHALARLWRYLLVAAIVGWFSLWPGVPLLAYLFGFSDPFLVAGLTVLDFALLVSTLVAGFAYDSVRHRARAPRARS